MYFSEDGARQTINLTSWPLEWRVDWTGMLQLLFQLFSFAGPPEKSCAPDGHRQWCDITTKYPLFSQSALILQLLHCQVEELTKGIHLWLTNTVA